jgi:hypothetical protein
MRRLGVFSSFLQFSGFKDRQLFGISGVVPAQKPAIRAGHFQGGSGNGDGAVLMGI